MLRVRQLRAAWGIADVSLLLPAVVVVVGVAVTLSGRSLGIGIAIGSVLALVNSAVLVKRVEFAVDSANAAIATVSMQVGLVLTFAAIGGITLILLIVAVPVAIAMGITFFIAQTGEILLYFRARNGRPISTPSLSEGTR